VKVRLFSVYKRVPFEISITSNHLEAISLLPELINALTHFIDKLNGLEESGVFPTPQKPAEAGRRRDT